MEDRKKFISIFINIFGDPYNFLKRCENLVNDQNFYLDDRVRKLMLVFNSSETVDGSYDSIVNNLCTYLEEKGKPERICDRISSSDPDCVARFTKELDRVLSLFNKEKTQVKSDMDTFEKDCFELLKNHNKIKDEYITNCKKQIIDIKIIHESIFGH